MGKDVHYCVATLIGKALEVASMGQKQRPAVVAEAVTYEISQMEVSDNTY